MEDKNIFTRRENIDREDRNESRKRGFDDGPAPRERTSFGRGGGSSGPPRGGFNSMRGGRKSMESGRGGGGGGVTSIYNYKLKDIAGPTYDLPPIDSGERKFSQGNKIYIGGLALNSTEAWVKELCNKYGEVNDVFVNTEKRFAFVKFDYKANADRFRIAEDGKEIGDHRNLKIRNCSNNAAVKVKNLGPMISNELLYKAFSVFGHVESALVVMDEKGMKSKGEGIVEYGNKHHAVEAINACRDSPFVLTRSLIPVIVEPYEGVDSIEGLPESMLMKRDDQYRFERETGPRFIQPGSFDYKFCEKYKQLTELRKEKEEALEREMKIAEEQLWSQMENARFEFETIMMKEQVQKREEERLRRIEMAKEQEQNFNRRMEMEREQLKMRENMFDFNIRDNGPNSGMGMDGGGNNGIGMGNMGGGMGNMGGGMGNMGGGMGNMGGGMGNMGGGMDNMGGGMGNMGNTGGGMDNMGGGMGNVGGGMGNMGDGMGNMGGGMGNMGGGIGNMGGGGMGGPGGMDGGMGEGPGGMNGGMGNMAPFNPEVWDKFGNGGGENKRPVFPGEVFGRGGSSSGMPRFGRGGASSR